MKFFNDLGCIDSTASEQCAGGRKRHCPYNFSLNRPKLGNTSN